MTPPQVQRSTSYLLGCEACGKFEPPPVIQELPRVAAPDPNPLRCASCHTLLTLFECFVSDDTTMWQERPGGMWHHVAFIDQLPTKTGRQIWTTS